MGETLAPARIKTGARVSNFSSLEPAVQRKRTEPSLTTNKVLLATFWIVCVFLNYPIYYVGEGPLPGALGVAHIAQLVLFAIVFLLWLADPKMRRWNAHISVKIFTYISVSYICLRTMLAYGNPLFIRHGVKLVLFVLMIITYKLLDPEGRLFSFAAWFLPTLLAIALGIRIVQVSIEGTLFQYRLTMPPYSYEVVGIMTGLMVSLFLFTWQNHKKRRWTILLITIAVLLLAGMVLSAVRGGLLAASIALLVFLYLSRKRLGRKLLLTFIFVLIVVSLSAAYRVSATDSSSRLDPSADPTFSARTLIYLETLRVLTANTANFFWGVGLGGVDLVIPGREPGTTPSAFSSLLSAWINFGLVGLFAYAFLLYSYFRRVYRMKSLEHRIALLPLFCGFVASDVIDSRWEQTQGGWFIAYIMYCFIVAPRLSGTKANVSPAEKMTRKINLSRPVNPSASPAVRRAK